MSNTFTAQGLADFYQKVADGGEAEFRANYTNKQWFSSSGSPCLSSVRQDWRIKPTKKVIDLSVLIESGIDCEFKDDIGDRTNFGKLLEITDADTYPYKTGNSRADEYAQCQPRMNHVHAWQGGECPLPDGFKVKVWYRNGGESVCSHVKEHNKATNLRWTFDSFETAAIIAFEVLGVADGYLMPWEQDNESKSVAEA